MVRKGAATLAGGALITYQPVDVERLQRDLQSFLDGRTDLRDGEYRVRTKRNRSVSREHQSTYRQLRTIQFKRTHLVFRLEEAPCIPTY